MSGHRRRFLGQLAATGLIANIPLFIHEALAAGQKPVAPGMYKISGTVTVNGRPAFAGMLVKPGDTVKTGPGSQAIYVVGQDAFLQQDNSTVNIVGEAVIGGLRLVTGKLLSVFGKGQKKIETPTATIGIRGTGCYIESDPARMYICLCYGEADYTPTVAPNLAKRFTATHHESVWISGQDAQQPFSKAPMINHTDAELTLLENLVGRNPPFSANGY